jgi:hypothetical protein
MRQLMLNTTASVSSPGTSDIADFQYFNDIELFLEATRERSTCAHVV